MRDFPMSTTHSGMHARKLGLFAAAVLMVLIAAVFVRAQQQTPEGVLKAETERVAVIEKVKPSVVAVFGSGGKGGGSGVLVSEDGYALTNFHVVAGAGSGYAVRLT
jgi:S1-C subfamily serine protease